MDLTMMERGGDRKKLILFDRPKPTVGCSAGGRRKKRFYRLNGVKRLKCEDGSFVGFCTVSDFYTCFFYGRCKLLKISLLFVACIVVNR
jgi:hypothetical protein